MRTSSEFLLTFLLNACWQILLIASVASLGSWFLRHSSARYRHWLWVSALLLSFLIPVTASTRFWFDGFATTDQSNTVAIDTETLLESRAPSSSASSELSSRAWHWESSSFIWGFCFSVPSGFMQRGQRQEESN